MIRNFIEIPKSIDLLNLDKLNIKLHQKIKRGIIIDLIIPVELKNNYLGISANLIQFTSTWLRSSVAGKLVININIEKDNPKLLDAVIKNEFLFPIIGLVWNNNGVYDNNNNNLRKYLKPVMNDVFLRMSKVQALKGDKLLLTNLDHFPEESGLLSCFEKDKKYISNSTDLAISLEEVLTNNLLRNYNETLSDYRKIKRPFSKIIYELMKNTYEWARTDVNNVPFDPNIRGLIIKFTRRNRNNLLEDYKNNRGISNYFSNERLKENTKGEIYFLEISVFDSGEGFVSKYKSLNSKSNDSLSDIEIIKKCLIKHNTSSKGLNKGDKGIGLDKILRIINGKGWIRIKTGKKCIYRNLITHPYIAVSQDDISRMKLFDWTKNSDTEYSNYESVSGSVITIVFPLSLND